MGYGIQFLSIGLAAALAATGCANRNAPAPGNPSGSGGDSEHAEQRTSDEARFALALVDAAYDGEERLAELATERAESPRVRAHAEDLLEDYERLGPQLAEVAEEVDVDLEEPVGISAHVARELDSVYRDQHEILEAAADDEFDRAYLSSLAATYRATIAELERIEPRIDESEVRDVVQDQLPIIRRHLERTEDVAEREGIDLET